MTLAFLLHHTIQARRKGWYTGDMSPQFFGKFHVISKNVSQRSVGQMDQKLRLIFGHFEPAIGLSILYNTTANFFAHKAFKCYLVSSYNPGKCLHNFF